MIVYEKAPKNVRLWLWIGIVMIFFQVVFGGITRLTGSGLSITKWEIVTGSIPPLSQAQWDEAFDLYKATPQHQKINKGMELQRFKFIYFWEYFHRLWGRVMGLVFVFPLIYFLRKRMISKSLLKDLAIVFVLTALVASFGWIMVASGLMDRPWVNAYKLMIHLSLAVITFGYLIWTYLKVAGIPIGLVSGRMARMVRKQRVVLTGIGVLVFVQIMIGGLMSGMKAGFAYPTFPLMGGTWIPEILYDGQLWTWQNMLHYDSGENLFAVAIVQVLHRHMAYLLVLISGYFFYLLGSHIRGNTVSTGYRMGVQIFGMILVSQVILGIFTLLGCQYGKVPLFLGVLHQAFGVLTFAVLVFLNFVVRQNELKDDLTF